MTTVTSTKYYFKFLNHDRLPAHGGFGQWPEPGTWTKEIDPIPCEQGWHLCRKKDIFHWTHNTLWVVEAEGVVEDFSKVVARRARLVRQVEEWYPKNARLFAADCAERVLHVFESQYPDDDRPRKAIETARRYARGVASEEELDTARTAAWSAARSGSAARSAALSAAWAAARSAAWAAGSAARTAAEAERDWQIEHLFNTYLKLDPNDFH